MRCRTIRGLVVSTILLSSLTFAAVNNPTVIYVNASADGANTGTSWADAFTTLQPALDAAQAGSEIWVAVGTYKPTKMVGGTDDRFKTFQMKNGVGIYGGFAGIETERDQRKSDPNITILSGDSDDDDINVIEWTRTNRLDNCSHLFYHPSGMNLDATAILDGFTLRNGGNSFDASNPGAGMYNGKGNNVTVTNCIFKYNISQYGGGMYNEGSRPLVSQCVFLDNLAEYGGGIYNYLYGDGLFVQCSFIRNSAEIGGGICNHGSSPVVRNCTFTENSAQGTGTCGGGMASIPYLFSSSIDYISSLTIVIGCVFERNYSSGEGWRSMLIPGGGGLYGGYKTINCVFYQNISSRGGGVLGGGTLMGCVFRENQASLCGGGAVNSRDIRNCSFIENAAGCQGGAICTSVNSIIRDCWFLSNSVYGVQSAFGGGIYGYGSKLSIINSHFVGNRVEGVNSYGGAICDYENVGASTFRNCTFLANSATGTTNSFGGGIYNYASDDVITNCILWGNSASQGAPIFTKYTQVSSTGAYRGTSSVTYSDIEGGFEGDGNISLPPQVVRYPSAGDDGQWGTADDDYGDLHLLPDSPCVDAGSNAAVPAEEQTGLMGTPRLADGDWDGTPVVDMGAYEYYLFGDLNLTADVTMEDMHLLAAHWMQTDCAGPDHCGQADINRSGTVDFDDFIILADHWLLSENITPPPPALPSPIAVWKMDATEGTVVADSIGGYEGKTVNIAGNPWQAGYHGYALRLDGINDYVQVTGFEGITGPASRTCSAWIKATANSKEQTIISWGNGANGQKWMFRMQSDGKLAVGVWGGYIYGNVSVADGQWHHVAAVLAADSSPSVNEIKLYVDGLPQIATYSSTQPIDTLAGQNVQIGSVYNGTSQASFFNGLLDDVRIYNLSLDANQIYRLSME
ncbi:MAG TPA: choice-of-anchor Q domain-containing protein [Anaerohalosphaeraceae bacterium]|nr:choice-of-anchor Q domain-containing protein [Anaerohalosphaeraceae bacterium]